MNCRDFEILLQLAADGEITRPEQGFLEEHLDVCVACRRKEAWLQLLEEQFVVAVSPSLEESSLLADAVVEALRAPQSGQAMAFGEMSSPGTRTSKPRGRKKRLFSRFVSAVWSRRKHKRERAKAKLAREQDGSDWLDASTRALQLAPTSMDGFRAAKQGVSSAVSGPVQGLKWVAGTVTRKGR